MTVLDSTSRNQYIATSGQTVFPYSFEIFVKEDIAVLKNGVLLAEGTNYSVSGVGLDVGGNVTLTVGATAGDVLTIYRDMDLQRETDYQNSGDFLAQEVNDDFDRLWLASQQLNNGVDRSVKRPITDAANIDMTLPSSSVRSNKVMAFNAAGSPLATSFDYSTLEELFDVVSLIQFPLDLGLITDVNITFTYDLGAI